MHMKAKKAGMAALAVAAIVVGAFIAGAPESAAPPAQGASRLVSVQHLPEGEACNWDDLAQAPDNVRLQLMASLEPQNTVALLQQRGGAAANAAAAPKGLQPVRTIRDLDPTYSSISLDLRNNEVIMQDNNLWSYREFSRTDNTPPAARFPE